MSTVRISDVYVPAPFDNYMSIRTKQTMTLLGTGIIRDDANLRAKLAGGGLIFTVPFWKDLDDTESDTGSDDPDSYAVPGKIGTGTDKARRQFRTRGWSTANLTAELAGADPMQEIGNKVGDYWSRQYDSIMLASVRGVFADNAANDGGDMINNIADDSGGATTSANQFSAEAVMNTAQTMGDEKKVLNTIVMHSVIHNRLAQQQLIDYRPDADGKTWWSYFMDYRVHVSDRNTAIQGTNKLLYHTYLFGANAFGWAESPPAKPSEVESDPAAGDGAGVETLWTRKQFAIHPYGVAWTDTQVAKEFPSNAELALAANWNRVYPERKMYPMALLITNA